MKVDVMGTLRLVEGVLPVPEEVRKRYTWHRHRAPPGESVLAVWFIHPPDDGPSGDKILFPGVSQERADCLMQSADLIFDEQRRMCTISLHLYNQGENKAYEEVRVVTDQDPEWTILSAHLVRER